MRSRRAVCGVVLGIGLLALPPTAFYGLAEITAEGVVQFHGIDVSHSNAVKHSLAASYLYSGFRLFGLAPALSQSIVLQCGALNEFVELYLKRGRADSTAEITRDLRNNLIGVTVGRWLEKHSQVPRSSAIALLARDGIFELPPSSHLPAGRAGYHQARAQHGAETVAITAAVVSALDARIGKATDG